MELSISMIVDLSVLAFLLLFIIIGAIKGLFKSLIGVVVVAGSVYLGYRFSPALTPKAVEWVYPRISGKLASFIGSKFGYDMSTVTPETMQRVMTPVLSPVVRVVLWALITVIALLLLGFVGGLIGKLIKKTDGLKSFDRTMGAILGFITAFAICFLLVFGISKFGMTDFIGEKIDGSVSYKILNAFVPDSTGSIVVDLPVFGEVHLDQVFNLDMIKDKLNKKDNETDNTDKTESNNSQLNDSANANKEIENNTSSGTENSGGYSSATSGGTASSGSGNNSDKGASSDAGNTSGSESQEETPQQANNKWGVPGLTETQIAQLDAIAANPPGGFKPETINVPQMVAAMPEGFDVTIIDFNYLLEQYSGFDLSKATTDVLIVALKNIYCE